GGRCGCAYCVAAGTKMCECTSIVVDCGRASRPGLPCLRAAVLAYLFQLLAIGECPSCRAAGAGVHHGPPPCRGTHVLPSPEVARKTWLAGRIRPRLAAPCVEY